MNFKTISAMGLAVAMGAFAVLPASAATTKTTTAPAAKHFYVSLKSGSAGCDIVTNKPDAKMLVGKSFYKTEASAQKALKAAKACHV